MLADARKVAFHRAKFPTSGVKLNFVLRSAREMDGPKSSVSLGQQLVALD
jgi:hypothetical protein